MPVWPFKRRVPEPLTPTELRDKLIGTAASGSARTLRAVCRQYKSQVAEHVDVLAKVPDGMATDDPSIDRYFQCLAAVAQCLARDCGAPELWNQLCGDAENNPLVKWERWFGEVAARMQRLEYEELITEATEFIEEARAMKGGPARLHETYLRGRLGELLFHSGRVADSIAPFESALSLCQELNDVQGQITYLNNLIEAHCWLDDGLAVPMAESLLATLQANGQSDTAVEERLVSLRKGVPLCRIICVREGQAMELDEITEFSEGRIQFQFVRNRLSLEKTNILTQQGNQLAASGQHSDALEKYHEACDVDPHDPDPVYQSGVCLLELGAYAKAREAFEEVEDLAPGWFRCRHDRWLADGLDAGTISHDEFLLLRALEDGGLESSEARTMVTQAIDRFPDFAPLYLLLATHSEENAEVTEACRKGLELVEEPDLESRLLCALAGVLPPESPERRELVERAIALQGSPVANATARLMALQ